MNELVYIAKNYLEKIILFLGILIISVLIILFLNIESIRLVKPDHLTITKKGDYELSDLKNNTKISITGSTNNIFKSKQNIGNSEVYMFALKEYIFDFILISDKEYNTEHTFKCMDVSDSDRDLLTSAISNFNSPVEINSQGLLDENILNEESKNTLLQNTKGNFGQSTRLLNCATNVARSELELYFILFIEVLFLFLSLLFLFRHKFLDFIEDLYEDLQ